MQPTLVSTGAATAVLKWSDAASDSWAAFAPDLSRWQLELTADCEESTLLILFPHMETSHTNGGSERRESSKERCITSSQSRLVWCRDDDINSSTQKRNCCFCKHTNNCWPLQMCLCRIISKFLHSLCPECTLRASGDLGREAPSSLCDWEKSSSLAALACFGASLPTSSFPGTNN